MFLPLQTFSSHVCISLLQSLLTTRAVKEKGGGGAGAGGYKARTCFIWSSKKCDENMISLPIIPSLF